jgi:hypothetical protein
MDPQWNCDDDRIELRVGDQCGAESPVGAQEQRWAAADGRGRSRAVAGVAAHGIYSGGRPKARAAWFAAGRLGSGAGRPRRAGIFGNQEGTGS